MTALFSFLKKHTLAFLGIVGFIGACLFTFTLGTPPKVETTLPIAPVESPFPHAIAATGLIEASSLNLKISAQDSGIMDFLAVKEGQKVTKGQLLFTLDTRVAKADLLAKQAQERVAQAELKVSGVNLKLKTDDLNRARHMKEGVAITEATLTQRERAYEEAVAQVELSKESLKQAQAQTFLSQAYVERLSIKAPTDGKILKIYIRPGELLQNASTQNYALLLGKDQPLYIRVQIDENDLWRFDPKTPAKAYLKSHKEKTFDLKFVQLDPYASVKENLNGDNRQLIDTRVVELIYEILSPVPTLVIGQQMDIYIQSKNEY